MQENTPQFIRCVRFDSIPLEKAHYTDEGYLVDTPILTSVGIFEYRNSDGSIRRELRLPEHVFDRDSLASYEGKPIIITHDAGKVDSHNVSRESVGTILSKAYQDGDDVRAKIVVHDTVELKRCGLKELSLGYALDLINEEGDWNGEHYDAIQTNIRVNHLALVANARAGEQARLNIDGKNQNTAKKGGENSMKKTRRDEENQAVQLAEEVLKKKPEAAADDENAPEPSLEEKLQEIKERKDTETEERCEPQNLDEANEIIKRQDEDISTLLEALEAKQAEKDFETGMKKQDADDSEKDEPAADDEAELAEENKNEPKINADSIDRMLRARLSVVRVGDRLNLDGLEKMSLLDAKKAVIRAVNPSMRFDGRSAAYINAAYDFAVDALQKQGGVNYQRREMYGNAGRSTRQDGANASLADKARKDFLKRQGGNI